MNTNEKIIIFLVDDDPLFLRLLENDFLQHTDFIIECYPTGESAIQHLSHKPAVIILDYYLNGVEKNAMHGLEVLNKIKSINLDVPIIMLSSQDKIEIAIECIHHKAHDYVVKSETAFVRLQKIIAALFQYRKIENQLNWYMERM